MKYLIKSVILLFIVNTSIMAQEKQYKGFKVSKELEINVSADKLWEMVGKDFENVYLWSSTVDHSEGTGKAEFEGATCSDRYCDLNAKGFSKISEKLTKYSDEDMNLAYEVYEGMPNFIEKAANDWQVVPIDDTHSKLVMNAEFQLSGLMGAFMKGMMKKKMGKLLDDVLLDAKVYAETGQPSENKLKRMEKIGKISKVAAS